MKPPENENLLPVVIGRNSSGESYSIDLSILPNLFISYHDEIQLATIFNQFMDDLLKSNKKIKLAASFTVKINENLQKFILPKEIEIQLLQSGKEESNIHTIDEFISLLLIELKNRRRISKQNGESKLCHTFLIVFIDNIFEVIKSIHKKTGLGFIELLVKGQQEAIHLICGSSGIYKNLLDQLINVSPALNRKLIKTKQLKNIRGPLAAELIINPDDLIFFKKRDERVFVRLYPN